MNAANLASLVNAINRKCGASITILENRTATARLCGSEGELRRIAAKCGINVAEVLGEAPPVPRRNRCISCGESMWACACTHV